MKIRPLNNHYLCSFVDESKKAGSLFLQMPDPNVRRVWILSLPDNESLHLKLGDACWIKMGYEVELKGTEEFLVPAESFIGQIIEK